MRVAFIGIGAMGEPMAANLLKKGFAVLLRLRGDGARGMSTIAELWRAQAGAGR